MDALRTRAHRHAALSALAARSSGAVPNCAWSGAHGRTDQLARPDVFLFVGLAQHGDLSKQVGYGIAIPLAVITLGLAAVPFKQRKDAGE